MWLRPVLILFGEKMLPTRPISATLHASRTRGYGNATNILEHEFWRCVFLLGQAGRFPLNQFSSPDHARVFYNCDLSRFQGNWCEISA
jgi:hypothetical protein